MILVDAPFENIADARHWFDAHWRDAQGDRLAGIQTWVEFRSADWFRRRGGDYVLKDVRKVHGKRYEQEYERMPRGWRTFRSHQLVWPATVHQEHENKAYIVCTAKPGTAWYEKQRDFWVERVDWHVPAPGGCVLPRHRARGRRVAKCDTRSDQSAQFAAVCKHTEAFYQEARNWKTLGTEASASVVAQWVTSSQPELAGCGGESSWSPASTGGSEAFEATHLLSRTTVHRSLDRSVRESSPPGPARPKEHAHRASPQP